MKIDTCRACGQYHDEDECEFAIPASKSKQPFPSFSREERLERKEKKFVRRPPRDKMMRWDQVK